jgi:phospholipid/cholesterol/gamma-HCH transport system substrate-binding protein
MDTNVNYTIVGLFVITLVIAFTLAIIWLSSGFKLKSNNNYVVYISESVAGLNVDSPVEFNGVNVGSVKTIAIDHNNPQRVRILITVQPSTPVSLGTVATLNTRGVTGMTYMALKDLGKDLRPLEGQNGHYPIIKSAPSLFTRLDTALSQLSTSFLDITKTFQKLFDSDTQTEFKHTIANLQRITASLAENNQRLTNIISNTAHASDKLTPLLSSSVNSMHTIETQTLPATYRILQNLDAMSRNLAEVSMQLRDNPAVLIRGSAPAKLGPGESP